MTDAYLAAAPAPLTDAERAWLLARAAALAPGADVHPGVVPAGADGRIVLSTDAAASAVAPVAGAGGVATFLAEQAPPAGGPGKPRWAGHPRRAAGLPDPPPRRGPGAVTAIDARPPARRPLPAPESANPLPYRERGASRRAGVACH
jgi:hypothetical protein